MLGISKRGILVSQAAILLASNLINAEILSPYKSFDQLLGRVNGPE
jgi:hypothetical protein